MSTSEVLVNAASESAKLVERALEEHREVVELVHPLQDLADAIVAAKSATFRLDDEVRENAAAGRLEGDRLVKAERLTEGLLNRLLIAGDVFERVCKVAQARGYDLSAERARVREIRDRVAVYLEGAFTATPASAPEIEEYERLKRALGG